MFHSDEVKINKLGRKGAFFSFDKFWLHFTPKFFEWLGWTTMLTAVSAAIKLSEPASIDFLILIFIKFIGSLSLLFYFQAYFFQIDFYKSYFRNANIEITLSVLISALLTFFSYYITIRLSDIIILNL